MTKATETRQLTDQLRAIHAAYRGTFARANIVAGVVLDRRFNRRIYALNYWNNFRAGSRIMVDVGARELWVRPVSRATRGASDPLDVMAVDMAAHTLFIDALMQTALDLGYTLNTFSETPETLATWRANR
jgi:hypothetical protein